MLAATLPESSENGVTKRGRGRPPIITLPLVQEVGRLIAKGMTEEQACLRVGINPNGVWSYGWKSTITGAFTAFASARTASFDNGVPAELWELGVGQITAVFSNQSTETGVSDGGNGSYPPGTVWVLAGFDGRPENFGVVRFTVPDPIETEFPVDAVGRFFRLKVVP